MELIMPIFYCTSKASFLYYVTRAPPCLFRSYAESNFNIHTIQTMSIISFSVGVGLYLYQLNLVKINLKTGSLRNYIAQLEHDSDTIHKITGVRLRKLMATSMDESLQVIISIITNAVLGTLS
jgi:hypothetical protein